MLLARLLIALMALCLPLVQTTLAPADSKYNILLMMPCTFSSHRNVLLPIAAALAQRGHKVTLLNNLPPPDSNPNITYLDHGVHHLLNDNMFLVRDDPNKVLEIFEKLIPDISNKFYNRQIVKDLYQRRSDFDIIIFDLHSFYEMALPFAHGKPFIAVSTPGLETYHSALMGNVHNPAYVPCLMSQVQHPMSFVDRLNNIVQTVGFAFFNLNLKSSIYQPMLDIHFPNLPPVQDMEREVSLEFINHDFSLMYPARLLPTQIAIGGIYCRPAKKLPKDLEDFLSGPEPAIYFSLGTVSNATTLPPQYLNILVEVFSRIPYKILWKFEDDSLSHLPSNIMTKSWLPQQDVLGHPNVKLFMSHCGLLSSSEAMYHAVPVLALPVIIDQPKNARRMVQKGVAQMLVWEELTAPILHDTIQEMMNNPSYKTKASTISTRFKDQPQSATDRAVYWTEYAIRHGGTKHLRSPERDLTWRELLHLDIILVLYFVLFLMFKSAQLATKLFTYYI